MVLLLSRPEEDFSEGKFFTIVDGQEHTADMKCGDLLIFRTSCLHGCTSVRRGRNRTVHRWVVGFQFPKRQDRRKRVAWQSTLPRGSQQSALRRGSKRSWQRSGAIFQKTRLVQKFGTKSSGW
eukprot:Skav229208  [mRNA]  locus=scaffold2439:79155:79954:+ [translate_table: standard]